MSKKPPSKNQPLQLVWDFPTRLFHWLLAIAVSVSLITIELEDLSAIDWHMYSGYCLLGLLIFRLMWGFLGTQHARFSSFLSKPSEVITELRYLARKDSPSSDGHNPAGGWMVVVMLAVLLTQTITGLFAVDEVFLIEAPLASMANDLVLEWTAQIHSLLGEYLIIALIVLHLAAVSIHQLKGHPIINAMWHGKKPAIKNPISSHKWVLAAVIAGFSGLSVFLLVTLP